MNLKKSVIFLTLILIKSVLLIEAKGGCGFGAALGGGILGSFMGTSIANSMSRPSSQVVETRYVQQPAQQPTVVVVQQPHPSYQSHHPGNNPKQYRESAAQPPCQDALLRQQKEAKEEIETLNKRLKEQDEQIAELKRLVTQQSK